MKTVALLLWISLLFLTGCNLIKVSSKYNFSSGVYRIKTPEGKTEKRFVLTDEDTIKVYRIIAAKPKLVIDTIKTNVTNYPKEIKKIHNHPQDFKINTLDLDFLTILFKYRPETAGFPRQLNTNFNSAFYLGYRSDIYRLRYSNLPIQDRNRNVAHYGYSFGLFSGLGATDINPWVTNQAITSEYDGLVWVNGLSGIVGVNNFTIGLGLGFDNLLDKNRDSWIYQHKLWLGLTLGVNLN